MKDAVKLLSKLMTALILWSVLAATAWAGSVVAPKVGALAPNFNLVDITGNQISLSDYRGKPVVVSFFHTW
jgi:cytochrome oxidase Cu insertion factor (SCO1/SenC/PrrC family)